MVDHFGRGESDINVFQTQTRSYSCMRRVVLVTSGAWATRANHDLLNIDIAKQQESSTGQESTTPPLSVEAIVGIDKVATDSATGVDSSARHWRGGGAKGSHKRKEMRKRGWCDQASR